jgi:3-isopropylmalate/(R)-2-methylmalate dehydratase small subunit
MEKEIIGKAFVLGDNIDTDQIIPAEHLVYSLNDADESKKYGHFALSGVPFEQSGLPEGKIAFINGERNDSDYKVIVGGANFGCGSSREHAPFALEKAGVKAVVAESYARIFFRNAVDGGFIVPYETKEKINNKIKTNDEIVINLVENKLVNKTSGESFELKPLGDILPIIEAGNIFEYARKSGLMNE